MGLHLLRQFNRWFALAAFWSYLVAFALAFTMVVIFFPVGALVLLFAGILILPVVVFVSIALGAWERAWCRRWLRAERCPACRAVGSIGAWPAEASDPRGRDGASAPMRDDDERSLRNPDDAPCYECRRCGAFFAASGEGVESPLLPA